MCLTYLYITFYADEVAVLNSSSFQYANVPIFLDEIVCSGGEISLLDCDYSVGHRCLDENDVAVICHCKLILVLN